METAFPPGNTHSTPGEPGGESHRLARERGGEAVRRNIIDAASQLLMQEGPQALTVRRLAQKLDCSTKILYTMFSGKDGVASGLYLEGCTRLHRAIAQIVPPKEPAEYLWSVARAYWSFSLTQTGYYRVMFEGAIAGFHPDRSTLNAASRALVTVVAQIRAYVEAGKLDPCDPLLLTRCFWGALHGVISLNLLGHFESREQALTVFEETMGSMLTGLVYSR
jgi:AcrR family transcriptional regulator